MPEGSGTFFWLLSFHHCIDVTVCLLWHSFTQRKQWKDEIGKRLHRIEAVNNHCFKLPYKQLMTLYFEMIHKRSVIYKAIENTSCSIGVLQAAARKLVKLGDGKLFRVARMKANKKFIRTVQNWLDRKFMHELQHEVICVGKSFTCISDGLWGEHYCSGTRSCSWFR